MKLYTKTGDGGFTMLPGADGRTSLRIRKDDARLAALGVIDELHAAAGMCVVEARRGGNAKVQKTLARIQDELFRVGGMLASIGAGATPTVRLDRSAVARMEREIDALWAELGELKHFIVPGGCELAARLHVARALARRAERAVVTALDASQSAKRASPARAIQRYLNRLSDLLFALARLANRDAGCEEELWNP